ncbi:hypothetical protein [Methylocystis iwaonis]|uniref:hypothetical protein n=1 Tax=Methylocystis iwaonis TaxID=2885079 RepID=UPI00249024AE|nr:hypothetical protein [Methylocystis iwaonis]
MSEVDLMGWQGQHNRDEAEDAEWRKLPLRKRYDWPSIALFVIFLGAFLYALWKR